jgi:light-regulated signal transduction histidine kinase (bacteriophytochrome)
MYAMIDGVLNYSTLNITDQIVERVDLNEVMRNIEADLEVVIQQKNAVIEYGHLPALEGSAVLLNQLFYNLVYNSLKFSNTHITPKILIMAAPLSGSAAARDWNLYVQETYVQLTVQDNGIGFSQDQAERIFKTFTRLNAKDKYEGTGLGLALCKKIAERHNGAISAAGMEGMGAIFKVVLPLQQTRKTD